MYVMFVKKLFNMASYMLVINAWTMHSARYASNKRKQMYVIEQFKILSSENENRLFMPPFTFLGDAYTSS